MNVAIVGATGYGGIQAVNLLKKIKKYKISFLGGNKTSGLKWNDNFPFIYLENDPYIEEISVENISKNADVALLCLPNGLSSTLTRKLLDRGLKVIDLSADYRYKSLDEWKNVYSKEAVIYKRNDDDLCKEAVYGLPEIIDAICSISEVCLWFINPYADKPSPHSDKSSFWFGSRPPPEVPLLESITIPSFSMIP